ncbi:MAG: glycoside hydrolase family 27 protein [Bacteroidia bacterium]|nr:glycoside hydrolase family 27 protein [Bacteroidia bacterium]
MRNFTSFIILSYILINQVIAQSVSIPVEWKFSTGDQAEWAKPDFNDSGWKTISAGKAWEKQGYKDYDGFAWYRNNIFIPSEIRKSSLLGDSLKICLGKIDDCDETYLNGILIGKNAGKPCDKEKGLFPWNDLREYIISVSDPAIRWDEKNVLAVKVFDQGGQGGMFDGLQEILMIDLVDYLEITTPDDAYKFWQGTDMKYSIILKNKNPKMSVRGELSFTVRSLIDSASIYTSSFNVDINPNSTINQTYTFLQHDNCLAVTTFTEKKSGKTRTFSTEVPYVLTPRPSALPGINGAKIAGVRPGSPFLYRIAATGEPPLVFKAENLPGSLSLDEKTGIITGKIKKKGEFKTMITVTNKLGIAKRELKIICGEQICLTPPMGWNSWNCWGLSVSDEKVRRSAASMLNNLASHGWTYINIDDGWELKHSRGKIVTNDKCPDMKALCSYIHSLGLKTGIYSSPGPKTCGGYEGSYTYEKADAASYGKWGIDYLKYDWCSYDSIAKDTSPENLQKPYQLMKKQLDKSGRDIVFSLCQLGMGEVWKWGGDVGGNLWRTSGDISDDWKSMSGIGFSQDKCSQYAGPGHWNDPDMLVVGKVGWGPSLHNSKLSCNEQYTHISLWSLLSAPLLIGCDLDQLDEFTLNILTNDEVLEIDQDPLGKQARQLLKNDNYQLWKKDLADGSVALGIFNTSTKTEKISISWEQIQLKGSQTIRDVWRQKDTGTSDKGYQAIIAPHGVVLLKVTKVME